MRLYIHHDAKALARLVGMSHPCCEGIFVGHGSLAGKPLASFADGNPLSEEWALDIELPGDHIVCWSGTLADELFGDEPRTWMREGHLAFRDFCDAAAPTLVARDRTLAFRPHARHVLSDVQGCVNLLREREGQPFALAVGITDLLTPSMLPDLEDHLRRIVPTLAPRAAMLLLHDAVPDGDRLRPVPLASDEAGCLNREPIRALLRDLLGGSLPPDCPVVLLPGSTERQVDWLGL
jgi:hypothetical protein